MKHHSFSRTRIALGIGALLLAGCNDNDSTPKPEQPTLGHRTVSLIEQDGLQFKDLDGNGTLTPYEDWRLGATERARDLVGRLTLAQKAGLMMHGTLVLDADGRVNLAAMDKMLRARTGSTPSSPAWPGIRRPSRRTTTGCRPCWKGWDSASP